LRNLFAVALLALASALPASAIAADRPASLYMTPDEGLGGWYLRGSKEVSWDIAPSIGNCACGTSAEGWDWGLGLGIGYEFGSGPRIDGTWDYLASSGSTSGGDALTLNSHLLLGNIYFDFGLGANGYTASGGWMAYVGAGAGGAVYSLGGDVVPGAGFTLAAAAMAGIGYDLGNSIVDVGYRLAYLNELRTGEPDPVNQGVIDGFYSNQFRLTWRYRFN